jgi:hypothetical protein
MNVYFGSAIPAFRRHVTIFQYAYIHTELLAAGVTYSWGSENNMTVWQRWLCDVNCSRVSPTFRITFSLLTRSLLSIYCTVINIFLRNDGEHVLNHTASHVCLTHTWLWIWGLLSPVTDLQLQGAQQLLSRSCRWRVYPSSCNVSRPIQ